MNGAETPVRVAFIGSVVPRADEPQFPLMSHASARFQARVLEALARAPIVVDLILSVRQVLLFPRERRVWFGRRRQVADEGPRLVQLPFVNIPAIKTATLAWSAFAALLRWSLAHRASPRLILLYNLYPVPAIVSLAVARLSGARVVGIVADLHVPGAGMRSAALLNRIDFRLQTWAMPRLDGLVVLARRAADDFGGAVPTLHMEGGVEEEAPPASRNGGELAILYTGGLAELRGVAVLLEVFRRMRDPRYKLWITGRGDLEQAVKRAAAEDPRITYFGLVDREQLRDLYARAAVLVNPLQVSLASARYLFPSKLLEYMVTGRPVVTTGHDDVRADYGEHVVVSDSDTPDALQRAIEHVLQMTDEERDAFGARGRAFVVARKNWRAQGQRLTDFLLQVMRR